MSTTSYFKGRASQLSPRMRWEELSFKAVSAMNAFLEELKQKQDCSYELWKNDISVLKSNIERVPEKGIERIILALEAENAVPLFNVSDNFIHDFNEIRNIMRAPGDVIKDSKIDSMLSKRIKKSNDFAA